MQIPALIFNEGGWCKALNTSYKPGRYQPATVEEFNALAPFARKPVPVLVVEESEPVSEPENKTIDMVANNEPEAVNAVPAAVKKSAKTRSKK